MEIPVLNHGFIELVKHAADDLSVVNAARVSYNRRHEILQLGGAEDDEKLIGYLMKNHHGTPFEHNFFSFRVKAPIVVFREWHRHRIGHSYNEWSARYSELENEFYIPEYVRVQVGKPGAYHYEPAPIVNAVAFQRRLADACQQSYENYRWALDMGLAKEQARLFLNFAIYSEMYWSCNARSLMHFLALRNAETAMYEIRQFAAEAEKLFAEVMPITHAAFLRLGRIAP